MVEHTDPAEVNEVDDVLPGGWPPPALPPWPHPRPNEYQDVWHALLTNGFTTVHRRRWLGLRRSRRDVIEMAWPDSAGRRGDTLLVPTNTADPDYLDRFDAVTEALAWYAKRGVPAQAALDQLQRKGIIT